MNIFPFLTAATLALALASNACFALQSAHDLSGYRFIDSNELNGPIYNYLDISQTGDAYMLDDDDSVFVDFGFDFIFYGETYNGLTINTNGVLTFSPEGSTENYNSFESAIPMPISEDDSENMPFLAVFFDDLNPNDTHPIYSKVLGTAPNRQFIVQYNVPHIDDDNVEKELLDFQVILNESDNSVIYQYRDVQNNSVGDSGNSASVGIQGSELLGVGYSVSESVLEAGLAIRFEQDLQYIGSQIKSGKVSRGEPGETVYHTVLLKNGTQDDLALQLTFSEAEWLVDIPDNTGSLAPDEELEVTVAVTIPEKDALYSFQDSFSFMASAGDLSTKFDINTATSFAKKLTNLTEDQNRFNWAVSNDASMVIGRYKNDNMTIDTTEFFTLDTATGMKDTFINSTGYFSEEIAYVDSLNNILFFADNDLASENSDRQISLSRFDMDEGTLDQLLMFNSNDPFSVSADGQTLAFFSNKDLTGDNSNRHLQLFVSTNGGSTLQQVTDASSWNSGKNVIVSEDGSKVFFTSYRDILGDTDDGNPNFSFLLYVYDTENQTFTRLTDTDLSIEYVDVSADGNKLALIASSDAIYQVYTIEGDGSVLNRLTHHEYFRDYGYISLSANGDVIAVQGEINLTGENAELNEEIFIFNYDGSEARQVTQTGANFARKPQLSADGRWLFFETDAQIVDDNKNDISQLYLLDLEAELIPRPIEPVTSESIADADDANNAENSFNNTANDGNNESIENAEMLDEADSPRSEGYGSSAKNSGGYINVAMLAFLCCLWALTRSRRALSFIH